MWGLYLPGSKRRKYITPSGLFKYRTVYTKANSDVMERSHVLSAVCVRVQRYLILWQFLPKPIPQPWLSLTPNKWTGSNGWLPGSPTLGQSPQDAEDLPQFLARFVCPGVTRITELALDTLQSPFHRNEIKFSKGSSGVWCACHGAEEGCWLDSF